MSTAQQSILRVPTPSQPQLSFCAGDPTSITRWVKNLPLVNAAVCARELFTACRAINNWIAAPNARCDALDILRPYAYSVCAQLSKHFLCSSISLNEKQTKIAHLCQALQAQMVIGYKRIVVDLISHKHVDDVLLSKAIHHAIADSGQILLRSYQLYQTPPKFTWNELHRLYRIAESHSLLEKTVSDKQLEYVGKNTLQDAYVRILLLCSAKPHNLRQSELATLYDTSELWASFADLSAQQEKSAFFVIETNGDDAPQYTSDKRTSITPDCRFLNTTDLVKQLRIWAKSPNDKHDINVPKKITDHMLSHIVHAWGILWQRSFKRSRSDGKLQICVGLSALHYFNTDKLDLTHYISKLSSPSEPATHKKDISHDFSLASDDVWDNAFDAGGTSLSDGEDIDFDSEFFLKKYQAPKAAQTSSTQEPDKYPQFDVTMINSSPGGYCINWQGVLPNNVQTGELIGIKERSFSQWSLGLIRWIKTEDTNSAILGLELIAPRANASVVRLIQKTGDPAQYMHAFLLPAIKSIAQPTSLLVPKTPFKTGQRIELMNTKETSKLTLTKRIACTSSFNQFQFKSMQSSTSKHKKDATAKPPKSDFDSIWDGF